MKTDFKDEKKESPAGQASEVVRALSILYNNSRVYSIEHPVFKKTLAEHMPCFRNALADAGELNLSFLRGKIRSGSVLLDPGSNIFQSLAHTLEGLGISGFSIRRGVTSEEITRLIEILTLRAAQVSKDGLQKQLTRECVRHVREKKVSLEMEGKPTSVSMAGESKSVKRVTVPPERSAGKAFELDDTAVDFGSTSEPASSGPAADAGSAKKPFREFVTGALTDFAWKRADIGRVTDKISSEFEERLTERTEALRNEKRVAVRRLESVKNVVFAKLEALNVIAILVDTDLKVLAMTASAREFLGPISAIPPDSPLAECIKLKGAYMDITLKGRTLTAQTIASDTASSGETILLLTLNPE